MTCDMVEDFRSLLEKAEVKPKPRDDVANEETEATAGECVYTDQPDSSSLSYTVQPDSSSLSYII